ncbi:MAG: hypothetical protein JWR15_3139 [Prosthecobacter sp.]|nr:hypothetical protein [Prosthecobacter sp.]
MKHGLLLTTVLLAACMRQQNAQAASLSTDVPQQAAARIDAALMREYALSQEQQRKYNNPPLPGLPPLADDAAFLRRACIDLAARLPKADEVRRFLASSSPDKRAILTDALVREAGAAEARFHMLAETFRVKDDAAVISWLRQAAVDDRPYDQIITYLIGEGHMSRRDEGNAFRTGVETAYAVLGEDLHCAQCHDHAFNAHTQMECHQFAACFTSNDEFDNIRLPSRYWYKDGKSGDVVKPKLLQLTREIPPTVKKGRDQRPLVAQWITHESSRRFATVAALRTWSSLFGMPGQFMDHTIAGSDPSPSWEEVHGKSDIPATYRNCYQAVHPNPVTWIDQNFSPGSLQSTATVLADEFRRCGYRIGEFQRILARTSAYSRSGIDFKHGGFLAPAPHIRRLPAEVIWDVLAVEKSAQLPQVPPLEHPLRMLGRGTREWSDESITPISHELARFMINSPDMEATVAAEPAGSSPEDLFLSILGRHPNELEKAIAQQHRNESPQTATQDIAWALLNTTEFMFRP